jgi:hypothetical protein
MGIKEGEEREGRRYSLEKAKDQIIKEQTKDASS